MEGLGGGRCLYFRPHDIVLGTAETAENTGVVAGSFFAGSVIRIIVRLDDGQVVTVDALGHTRVCAGDTVGVVFKQATPVDEP